MKIVLVSGKMNSGKDYFSNLAVKTLTLSGFKAKRFALADNVKIIAKELYGWNGVKDEKGRLLLIDIGTMLGKGYGGSQLDEDLFKRYFDPHPFLWCDMLMSKIVSSGYDVIFVSDWRFKDEYVYFKCYFDDVVTVRVKENQRTKYLDNISEKDLDGFDFDYIIDNNNNDELDKSLRKVITGEKLWS